MAEKKCPKLLDVILDQNSGPGPIFSQIDFSKKMFFTIFFRFELTSAKIFFTPLWGPVTWDFFEFESYYAYYASIKRVEAFAIDTTSRKNLIFA